MFIHMDEKKLEGRMGDTANLRDIVRRALNFYNGIEIPPYGVLRLDPDISSIFFGKHDTQRFGTSFEGIGI